MRKSIKTAAFAAALCLSLGSCQKTSGKYMRYEDADRYTAGEVETVDGTVKEVEIDWLGGTIEVEQSADGGLRAVEDETGLDEASRMQYLIEGGTLKIKYCRSGYCGDIAEGSKHLRLEIPQGLDVEIDATTAEINMGVVDLQELSVESRSGNFSAEKITCRDLDIETKSGKVYVGELVADEADVDTADGDIHVGISTPLQAEIESKSGNVTLKFNAEIGLRAKFCTRSGELITSLPYEKKNGCYEFAQGVGGGYVEVKSVSGNLRVE